MPCYLLFTASSPFLGRLSDGHVCQQILGFGYICPSVAIILLRVSQLEQCNGASLQSLEQWGFPDVSSHPGPITEGRWTVWGRIERERTGGGQQRGESYKEGRERWECSETDVFFALEPEGCFYEAYSVTMKSLKYTHIQTVITVTTLHMMFVL